MALRLHTTLTASDAGFSAAMSGAEGRTRQLGAAAASTNAAAGQMAEEVKAAGAAVANAAAQTERLIEEANALASGMGRAANEALGAGRAMDEAGGAAERTAQSAQAAATGLLQQAAATRTATEASNAMARAQGEAATEAARRMQAQAQAARDAGEAQRRLNELLGVRPRNNDAADRAEDYAEWGRRIDAVRARYVPLEQQLIDHRRALDEIAQAERLGMLTSDEATAARTRATAALNRARDAANGAAGGTKLAAHEVTNLTYQLQDAAVQLAGGQNPFLILMQQGPQATAAVGGLGRLLSLIPPQLLLVAGVTAGLAVVLGTAYAAWSSYRESVLAVDRANRMAPVSIGLTRAALEQQAQTAADAADISVKAAREQQAAYIATGKIGAQVMSGLIGISRDFAVATGQDLTDATAQLAKSFADPSRAAEDLTRSMGLLDDASLANVRSLAAMGRGSEAQAIILEALTQRVKGSAEELTTLGRVVAAVGAGFSNAWDWIGQKIDGLFVERASNEATEIEERLADLRRNIAFQQQDMARRSGAGLTPDNDRNTARLAVAIAANEALVQQHQDRLTEIQRKSEAERQADQAKAFGVAAGEMARQIDEFGARRRQLTEQAAILQRGLLQGTGLADRGQVEQQLDRVKGALSSLMTEQQKAQRLAQAEVAAVNMTGVARDRYLAKVRAEIETSGQLLTARERQERVDQAVATVTNQHAASVTDLTQQQRLAIEAQERLAAASGQGEAAMRAANDANEIAAAMARSAAEGALAVETAKLREAAAVATAANDSIASLTAQRVANDNMTAAIRQGEGAVRAAARAEFERAQVQALGVAATERLTAVMAAYDAQMASQDGLSAAEATAAQARELGRVNGLLGVERGALTASNRQRGIAVAHAEALNELARIGVHWTQEDRQAWLANADAIAAARVEAEELAALRDTAERVADDWAEAIYDGMTGRGDSIVDWFKSLFRRIAVEAIKNQIVMPIITQVVGSMPGLFGVGSGGGAGGGVAGVAGTVQQVGGAAGLAQGISGIGAGLAGGVTALGSSLFGTAATSVPFAFAPGGMMALPGTSGLLGSGGAFLGSTGLATGITGGLSGLGIGMGTASIMGMLGIGKGNTTGGAIGGAIGGVVGSFVPVIGTIVGSIVGGAIGSLFGAKPTDATAGGSIDLNSGRLTRYETSVKKRSEANMQGRDGMADAITSYSSLLLARTGGSLSGTAEINVGSRDGIRWTAGGQSGVAAVGDAEGALSSILAAITNSLTGIPDEIAAGLSRIDFADLEGAAKDIDTVVGFRDTLAALRNDLGLEDQVRRQASETVRAQVDAIKVWREDVERLGLDLPAADAALRSYVEGLVGIRQAAPAMNEAEAAMATLAVTFAEYVPLLQAVGYTAEEAQAAMATGLAKAKEQAKAGWADQLDREYNEQIGNGFLNQIADLRTARDNGYRNADAYGDERSRVDRNVGAALSNILSGDLRADQLQEVIDLFGGKFPEAAAAAQAALDRLSGAVTDVGDAAAQAARAAATADALGGLADRQARATGAADTLDGSLSIFDRSAGRELAAVQQRIAAGELGAEVLLQTERTLADERAAIGRSFADRAAAEAKAAAEREATVTRGLADRVAALQFADRPDADILMLERRQNAEFAAAVAAGHNADQLKILADVLGGEMTRAVHDLNQQTIETARQAAEQLAGINQGISDRLFASANDNSTLVGALAEFDRQTARERADIARNAGADLAGFDQGTALQRLAIQRRFNDAAVEADKAKAEQLAAVNLSIADRLFASANDNSTLAGALAAFDRQVMRERIDIAQTAGADLVSFDQAVANERLAIQRRFADQAMELERQRSEALIQAGGGLRQWVDGIRATVGTPEQTLAAARTQYQQQLALARGGNVEAVQGLREYAQRLIDAETRGTASGLDRRGIVEGILGQVEGLAAVKSYDQQQVELLGGILTATQGLGGAFAAAVAGVPAGASGAEIATALQPYFYAMDSDLNGLITQTEFVNAVGKLLGQEKAVEWFAALDTNGDDVISEAELTTKAVTGLGTGSGKGTLQAISDLTYGGNADRLALIGASNANLRAIGDLMLAGNKDRIALGNAANNIMAGGLSTLGTLIGAGNAYLAQIAAKPAAAAPAPAPVLAPAALNYRGGYDQARDQRYLNDNRDVAAAVVSGQYASGWDHYDRYGRKELRAYANGTDWHPGGWALVGEEGPEVVELPRGVGVRTAAETVDMFRASRAAVPAPAASRDDGEARALRVAVEKQNGLLERQNKLLEQIATASADGADASAEVAKVLKAPRGKVGTVRTARAA